jgi:hypothetical protein
MKRLLRPLVSGTPGNGCYVACLSTARPLRASDAYAAPVVLVQVDRPGLVTGRQFQPDGAVAVGLNPIGHQGA